MQEQQPAVKPGRGGRRRNRFGLTQDGRGIWHCDFSVAGRRFQRSTATADRAAAEEWCARLENQTWRERKLGEKPQLTWPEAVRLWFNAKQADGKRDIANDGDKARMLSDYLAEYHLSQLTTQIIEAALEDMTSTRGWSNGTYNRHRSFVTGVLNFARVKGYDVPELHIHRRREADDRVRWISVEEAGRMLRELPVHLQRMVSFSLNTGLRQSNVTGLEWKNVDMQRGLAWVRPEDAKAKKFIAIPLSETAMKILREARTCPLHGSEVLCFTYYGAPVQQPANSAWLKALRRAGINDFRWHDLRHTWASWHVQGVFGKPTPLPVLKDLGGWADIRMVLKYAHLAEQFTASYVGVGIDPAALTSAEKKDAVE